MIDIGVWVGVLVVLAAVGLTTFELLQPPTPEQLRARAESTAEANCRSAPSTQRLSAEVVPGYCGCVAAAVSYYGSLDGDGVQSCLRRSAAALSHAQDLQMTFASAFPQTCADIESHVSGRVVDANSAFCQCLSASVQKSPRRMAEYAFAGSEEPSQEKAADNKQCSPLMNVGSGWTSQEMAKTTDAVMTLPFSQSTVRSLRFRCDNGELSFAALYPNNSLPSGTITFSSDELPALPLNNGATASDVRALVRALQFADRQGTARDAVLFQVGSASVWITLQGLTASLTPVLGACPDNSMPASPPVNVPAGDVWKTVGPGHAILASTAELNWTGALACNQSNPALLMTIPSNALPSRPQVDLETDSGGELADLTCKVHGDAATCELPLSRDRIEGMATSSTVQMKIGSLSLTPFSFAKSKVLGAALPVCLKALPESDENAD